MKRIFNNEPGFRAVALGLHTSRQVWLFCAVLAVMMVVATLTISYFRGIKLGIACLFALLGAVNLVVAIALWRSGNAVDLQDLVIIACLFIASGALFWKNKAENDI